MKGHKITIARARELAAHLFEMELNMSEISSSIDLIEKYGEKNFMKFEDELTSDKNNEFVAPVIEKIAQYLKQDFASGYWVPTDEDIKNDSLYQIYMPSLYGGEIDGALDKQMAMLTGIGFQTELAFE
jgi:hypothetical protein